jgi:DnaJ homologue, subfamily C, member 28, conserved domain
MSDDEQRLHRAAVTKAAQQVPEPAEDEESDDAPAQRMEQQALWVDLQVRRAMERGDFDNLPGAGKPLKLPDRHDPDWWVKQLIEREKITAVLPPALGLRKEDAELDAVLDKEPTEDAVRATVKDFNRRVVEARRQLQGGPPVVTPTRDVEHEVTAWRERRDARRARQREQLATPPPPKRRRWWRRDR